LCYEEAIQPISHVFEFPEAYSNFSGFFGRVYTRKDAICSDGNILEQPGVILNLNLICSFRGDCFINSRFIRTTSGTSDPKRPEVIEL
jgi:hypothetical protein